MAATRPTRVRPGVVPPGGWHYVQTLAGGRTLRIPEAGSANDFNDLVNKVLVIRLANRVAPGDPHEDVEAYLCSKTQGTCYAPKAEAQGPTGEPTKPRERPKRFVDDILNWVVGIFRNRTEKTNLVPVQVAEARISVCVNCSHQKEWKNSCPACVQSAQSQLNLLRSGRNLSSPSLSKNVRGCAFHRWDNTSAAFLKEPPSGNTTDEPQPPNCWVKKTS
jgi:hypothetical protein